MIYTTVFKNAHQRLPMEGVPELLHEMVKGGDGQRENPVFYVSNSPWNIYDLLAQFMDIWQLPKGPILLRDYGRQIITNPKLFNSHKIETIGFILDMYPNLPFILLGDTASNDADYYLHFAEKYAGRIAAIYIRHTSNTKNARRVAALDKREA